MRRKTRDENSTRQGLRSVDWLLLAVLLAAVLLGSYLIRRRGQADAPTVEIFYTVCVSSVDVAQSENGDFADLIPKGAAVTNETGTVTLGRVTDVTVRPHRTAAARDGEIVMAESPNRVDLLVRVRAWATVRTGDGLRVGDIRIAAGRAGDFRIGALFAGGCEVIAVERRGNE